MFFLTSKDFQSNKKKLDAENLGQKILRKLKFHCKA